MKNSELMQKLADYKSENLTPPDIEWDWEDIYKRQTFIRYFNDLFDYLLYYNWMSYGRDIEDGVTEWYYVNCASFNGIDGVEKEEEYLDQFYNDILNLFHVSEKVEEKVEETNKPIKECKYAHYKLSKRYCK